MRTALAALLALTACGGSIDAAPDAGPVSIPADACPDGGGQYRSEGAQDICCGYTLADLERLEANGDVIARGCLAELGDR